MRSERLARAATELRRLSPVAQVARREDSLRERRRRLDSSARARLVRALNALNTRRAPERLDRALTERFAAAVGGLEHRRQRLVALSPDAVLSRGYSITQDEESGAVVRSAAGTAPGRGVRIRLGTGRLAARVEKVDP
jgi:exodeoxyribonuclease VII large subunit